MSVNNKSGRISRKVTIALILLLVVLWIGVALLALTFQQSLLATIHPDDLVAGLPIITLSVALMLVGFWLLLNLYGSLLALILPARTLREWRFHLAGHPYTMYILRKTVERRLRPRYWTP